MSLSAKPPGSTLVLASSTLALPSTTNRVGRLSSRFRPLSPGRLGYRRDRRRHRIMQRLVHFSTHPQPGEPTRYLHRPPDRRPPLPRLSPPLPQPPPQPPD